jgi:hypothetical protein
MWQCKFVHPFTKLEAVNARKYIGSLLQTSIKASEWHYAWRFVTEITCLHSIRSGLYFIFIFNFKTERATINDLEVLKLLSFTTPRYVDSKGFVALTLFIIYEERNKTSQMKKAVFWDAGSKHLLKVDQYLPEYYMMQHPRRVVFVIFAVLIRNLTKWNEMTIQVIAGFKLLEQRNVGSNPI